MITLKCKQCGRYFSVCPYQIRNGVAKFCSKKCHDISQKGRIPWIKGKKHTEETKKKIKEARAKQGSNVWNKGKTGCYSKKVLLKMSFYRKGKQMEENSPVWKGDNVGYSGLHYWASNRLGKSTTCEHCGRTGLTGRQIHWANKDHSYKRNLIDWIRLCPSCHKKYDIKNGFFRVM
jgi:endogenous inhibitor of DNA gyrase (YacG/DUF329 family)